MKQKLKHLLRLFVLFLIFGAIYVGIEIGFRGYSHWSMYIVGGLCGVLVGLINEVFTFDIPIQIQMLIGAVLITAIEFVAGCVLNLWLKLGVWDYSQLPLNICGQVSLVFSLAWFFLSGVAIVLDDWLRVWLFGEEKPHYCFKGGDY